MLASKRAAKEMSSFPRQEKLKRKEEVNSSPSYRGGPLHSLPLLLPRPSEVGNLYYEYFLLPLRRRVIKPAIQNIEPQSLFLVNTKQILLDNFN